MTYRPRNRRLCLPPVVGFTVDGIDWYVDDAEEHRGEVVPFAWGREGSAVRVVTYGVSRFTLCDDRGRFLKRRECYRGEGKRRVQSFPSRLEAAAAQVRRGIESCE